ncbi:MULTISPECIES: carbohydrate ABC transporter permease [Cohnella]|uniref:Raffinose/stachyose/melibiose transport system permease protein n=1 Tax=Cohnella phaseoli TaxID=456490 RepID=A0A3D9IFU3_9BACL|nr:carbohydrate ABC transporter permease [Cohnella phaseoli]RED60580.1 raffinose/stachyose/melibiose transport system permease protein [Cohnella phaseoli]
MSRSATGLKKYYLSLELLLIAVGACSFYPVFLMIADAFKTREGMAARPFGLPGASDFTLDNLKNAIYNLKFYQPLFNSAWITLASIVLVILVSSLAAYPIARQKTRLYKFMYFFFLAGLMIPYQLAMITLYKEVMWLGLMNQGMGLVLVYGGIFLSFPIFFYSGFIKTVPYELEEAALMDGYGRYRIFFSIVFPLLKPATATITVLMILSLWNEFTMALLFLQKPDKVTLTVVTYAFKGQYHVHWPNMFAGLLISIVPMVVLFLSVQRFFIRGITAGALKG